MPALGAGLLVFTTSAAVLILEILAARLLAPYVGISLETYTAIIGVVLAGIALGNAAGGRLADRVDPRRLLGPLVMVGGLLALATIPLVRAFGDTGGGARQSIVLAAVGFFPPAAVLSAVTPTVAKLRLRDLAHSGSTVGSLSAVGTAGALAGTFFAGFFLVEAAPASTSIVVLGGGLLLVGAALSMWLERRRRGRAAGAGAAAVVLVVGALVGWSAASTDGECDAETTYHCANIEPEAAPGRPTSGRSLRLDTLRHSYVDLADPSHLEFRYTQLFAAAIDELAPAGPLDVVHVGGGGWTMPRYLADARPGSRNTVLEIDPLLVDLVRDRLVRQPIPGLEVVVGDGRLSVHDRATASADVVVGDAFGGLAVPWHLTTREAVADVRRVLRPGGLYVVNVIDYQPLRFARAEARTLLDVFGSVAVVAPAAVIDGQGGSNVVLVATSDRIDGTALLTATGGGERVLVDASARSFAGNAPVLRDDHAPVDQWLARSER
jgi:SAM-dependent methyltransferase